MFIIKRAKLLLVCHNKSYNKKFHTPQKEGKNQRRKKDEKKQPELR